MKYRINICSVYIYFNDTESDSIYLTTSVPQGSVLGPLLFQFILTSYVNDLENPTFVFNITMYADDTTFCDFKSMPEEAKWYTILNNELKYFQHTFIKCEQNKVYDVPYKS